MYIMPNDVPADAKYSDKMLLTVYVSYSLELHTKLTTSHTLFL